MATTQQFEKWQRALQATFPLAGMLRRRAAIRQLAELRDETEAVPILVEALDAKDPKVATTARAALAALTAQSAIDVLCDTAIRNPKGPTAQICLEQHMRPSDHERNCLFLFVTEQLDEYFKTDFEFQALRMEYDRADAVVKEHVMDLVRSGDPRCNKFIGDGGKRLAECNEREIEYALESFERHKEWDRLLRACLEMPLKYGLPTLEKLRVAGWQPDAPELRSLLNQALADWKGQDMPAPREPSAASSVFERWLAGGREGEYAALTQDALVERLKTATPPEGVKLVAALAAKASPGSPAAEAVRTSPHWLVRLAGQATGLTMDLVKDNVEDSNYWVKELSAATGVLGFWPGKATPADLEALSAAPAEAWIGRLGAARRVLRTIVAYRTTVPGTPMVIGPEEFSIGKPVQPTRSADKETR
jgi:hypothetical protein